METHSFDFTYQKLDITELSQQAAILYQECVHALNLSWSPYSRFQVGASILLENGQILKGANQENAAYPMCLCAERVALAAANSTQPDMKIISMVVLSKFADKLSLHPISPCGACRQVLLETENKQKSPIELYLGEKEGSLIYLSSSKLLLPLAFGGL